MRLTVTANVVFFIKSCYMIRNTECCVLQMLQVSQAPYFSTVQFLQSGMSKTFWSYSLQNKLKKRNTCTFNRTEHQEELYSPYGLFFMLICSAYLLFLGKNPLWMGCVRRHDLYSMCSKWAT
jgi:hypothetical protein